MLTRVPLIARVPGGTPGVRVAAPVQTLDLYATMLDLAGINASTLDRTHSVSLLPVMRGAAPPSWKPRPYASSEGGYVPGTTEMEPLDPAQVSTYADRTNLYWPRGCVKVAPPVASSFAVLPWWRVACTSVTAAAPPRHTNSRTHRTQKTLLQRGRADARSL